MLVLSKMIKFVYAITYLASGFPRDKIFKHHVSMQILSQALISFYHAFSNTGLLEGPGMHCRHPSPSAALPLRCWKLSLAQKTIFWGNAAVCIPVWCLSLLCCWGIEIIAVINPGMENKQTQTAAVSQSLCELRHFPLAQGPASPFVKHYY